MGCGSSTASAPGRMAGDEGDMDYDSRTKFDKKTGEAIECAEGKDDDGPESDFFEVEEAQGEQFMAVLPWKGQVAEPDSHNEPNPEKPEVTYSLEYVYGYRCQDSKQNCYWNAS